MIILQSIIANKPEMICLNLRVSRLQPSVHDRVEMFPAQFLSEAVTLAERAERQIGRGSRTFYRTSEPAKAMPSHSTPLWTSTDGEGSSSKTPNSLGELTLKNTSAATNRSSNPHSKPNPIIYYRCRLPAHWSNECPQRTAVHYAQGDKEVIEHEETRDEDDLTSN